jgi:hypothetical protein
MPIAKARQLDPGYTADVDTIDEPTWSRLLKTFDDANIYQTWPYASVLSGERNSSRLVLRKDGDVVALAQARIAKVPLVNAGVAHVRWGPVWRKATHGANVETFRQAIRALRHEFVHRRGLVLRLLPAIIADDDVRYSNILEQEGCSPSETQTGARTILMDLTPPLLDLREGMKSHWQRELKVAERKGLEVVEGTGEELFDEFIAMYKEMVSRKKFAEPNNINQFKLIQARLPAESKMKIMLCRSGEGACAGLVCSTVGKTAVYLFGATSNAGMKSRGSYLLHWQLISRLKQEGISVYDLNGINPVRNPGTYKFKSDLSGKNGKDVHFLGRFDSCGSSLSYWCVRSAEAIRGVRRTVVSIPVTFRAAKLPPKVAG